MERKDYLKEELTKEEKIYLKRIVMTAKNKYIERNRHYMKDTTVLSDETVFTTGETILDLVLERVQEEIDSAIEFEKTLSDPRLYNIVKSLSLREKEVLFYLYKKQKSINETADIMNLHRNSIMNIRDQMQKKIINKLIKGEI